MAQSCTYQKQLNETARLVAEKLGRQAWQVVYQSRSGPPSQPWLGPDIQDQLRKIRAGGGSRDIVVSPIGFVSDHMEIVFDLDTQVLGLCAELGLQMVRAETVGTHPRFIEMIRELIGERLDPGQPRLTLGAMGPVPDVCPADCCSSPKRPVSI
jgi:ferrochelatase